MRKKMILFVLLLIMLNGTALAAPASLVRKCRTFFPVDFPATHTSAIVKSPVPGLCEIHSGANVLYYAPPSRAGEHGRMVIGDIYTPEGVDLTVQVRQKLLESLVKKIKLDKAIKIGNGPVRVVEFTDPDCPFCRRLEKFFSSRPDLEKKITRYVFLFPLPGLHPRSTAKARWILCQADRHAAINAVMIQAKLDDKDITYPPQCRLSQVEGPLDAARKAGKELQVNGTPYLVVNGRILSGPTPQALENAISRAFRSGNK